MPRKTPDLEGYIEPGSEEETIVQQIDFGRLPSHVAIIMDGNGRWAQSRRLPRVAGHRAGIDAVRDIVEASARLGLQVLTLYAFSKENWKRPRAEINTLMLLLKEYLKKELRTLQRNDIRFNVIGRMEELDASVQRELEKGMKATRDMEGMVFNIALSYSGRAEIVDACRRLLLDLIDREHGEHAGPGALREAAERIDERALAANLYTAEQPAPDLLIRTSGEMRISNFLLWQIAYAEIWVTDTLWPDFRKKELFRAILDFQKRDRRYGGVAQTAAPPPPAPGRRRVV